VVGLLIAAAVALWQYRGRKSAASSRYVVVKVKNPVYDHSLGHTAYSPQYGEADFSDTISEPPVRLFGSAPPRSRLVSANRPLSTCNGDCGRFSVSLLSDRCDFTPPPSRFWLPGLPAWATGIATGSWKRRDGSALLKGAAKGVQPACYFTTLKQRLLPVYCAHPLRLRIRPMAARRTLQTPTLRVSTVFK
jgi:hypothetical protein